MINATSLLPADFRPATHPAADFLSRDQWGLLIYYSNLVLEMKALSLAKRNLVQIASFVYAPELLHILDVSCNSIVDIRYFAAFYSLESLDLSGNFITQLASLLFLYNLRNLKYLNLAGNPVVENEEFRLYAVRILPQLKQLNLEVVSAEEKIQASMMKFKTPLDFVEPLAGGPSLEAAQTNNFAVNGKEQTAAMKTLSVKAHSLDESSALHAQNAFSNLYVTSCDVQDANLNQASTRPLDTLKSPSKQLPTIAAIPQSHKNDFQPGLDKTKSQPTLTKRKMPCSPANSAPGKASYYGKRIRYAMSFEKPPQMPFKRENLQHMLEAETQNRIFTSICGLLELLDNAHLCMIEEVCKGKREGRGNPRERSD